MKLGALRICIIYILLSFLWITLSDKALFLLRDQFTPANFLLVSSAKGLFFVLITGFLFYKLIKIDEVRLKESEKKYRTMYEGNPLPMWIYDAQTLKITSVNSAAIKSYGYSEAEFLQRTAMDIRPKEDIPKLLEEINNLSTDAVRASDWTHIKADGSSFHVNIHSQKIVIDQKPYIMVIARDITEKVAFEERLKTLNQKLLDEKARLIDTQLLAKLGGWVLYLEDMRLEWSDEVYQITDHTPQPGESLFDVYLAHIYLEDRPAMIAALEALVKNGKRFDVTHRIRLHDGQTRYIHHIARLEYEDGKPYRVVGSLQDITEYKEKEIRIEQQNKVLQEIAWLNSHEIRGPVASILGLFNIYKEAHSAEEREKIIEMISTYTENLDVIVHNIAERLNKEISE
ncbi:PAS domain S-box protein [Mucilaginibacter agri]|uniref:histidine kinase n=1 Tax=Mucilaginibacter agri TaxID=2695265 RepID=A0A966DVS4_9SPHI|nr:PAS domain S-box protein [Mucilaginibacter agri]NCD71752.1 PAS domain S-box protein [Mucilaginibacter agri]